MVFSILALSGFEAPAPLAQEARRPAKFIGQAIMLSLVAIGIFYIFIPTRARSAGEPEDMAAFASNPNPYYVLGHALWGAGGGSLSSLSSIAPSASVSLAPTLRHV